MKSQQLENKIMEIDSQRGFQNLSFQNLSEPEQLHYSHARQAFECHSTRGPMAPDCLRKDCHFCTDIATIDEEISTAYQRIFDLIQKRAYFTRKPNHDTLIHRLPVEILSSIFIIFVKETSIKEPCEDESGEVLCSRPNFSPPLLVGSVCRKWRDVTLQTPQLWTDIIINLMKPVDAQLDMVNYSAHRSGALPLNLSIYQPRMGSDPEDDILERCDVLLDALKSLSIRWNDLALSAPWSVYYKLFDKLGNSSSIRSFHMDSFNCMGPRPDFKSIKLQEPFRPKYFSGMTISVGALFEWDNLVKLQIFFVSCEDLLCIIRDAKNLRHCDATPLGGSHREGNLPLLATPITHRSLTVFKTSLPFMDHLTLPSLQHLECCILRRNLNKLVEFNDRSGPPLSTFRLRCIMRTGDLDPCFKKLPGITSLSVSASSYDDLQVVGFLHTLMQPSSDAILPCLNELSLQFSSIPPSSWSLISRLFKKDTHPDGPHLKEMNPSATSILGRPLSRIRISVSNYPEMDKDTFLHLLAVKKSGFDLYLGGSEGDWFPKLAEIHDVVL